MKPPSISVTDSPSSMPQPTATTGIRYVTEDANTAVVSLISRLNKTTAAAVPITAKIVRYPTADQLFESSVMIEIKSVPINKYRRHHGPVIKNESAVM